jgi:hypothetical protein
MLVIVQTQGLPPGVMKRIFPQYVHSDASGRYSAEVPTSDVFVSAVWGKRQPCLASASVTKNTTLDVEVFDGSSPRPSRGYPTRPSAFLQRRRCDRRMTRVNDRTVATARAVHSWAGHHRHAVAALTTTGPGAARVLSSRHESVASWREARDLR